MKRKGHVELYSAKEADTALPQEGGTWRASASWWGKRGSPSPKKERKSQVLTERDAVDLQRSSRGEGGGHLLGKDMLFITSLKQNRKNR